MRYPLHLAPIAFGCLALTLCGCSTFRPKADPTHFYVLRSLAEASDPAETAAPAVEGLQVGPGSFPDYLRSSAMAVEDGRNGIRYLDLYHWAEPLEAGVSRVLGENLSHLLDTSNIATYPNVLSGRSGLKVTYRVLKLEGEFGARVVMEVQWEVTKIATDEAITNARSRYVMSAEGRSSNADEYAERMSEALHQWSLDIAQTIAKLAMASAETLRGEFLRTDPTF